MYNEYVKQKTNKNCKDKKRQDKKDKNMKINGLEKIVKTIFERKLKDYKFYINDILKSIWLNNEIEETTIRNMLDDGKLLDNVYEILFNEYEISEGFQIEAYFKSDNFYKVYFTKNDKTDIYNVSTIIGIDYNLKKEKN